MLIDNVLKKINDELSKIVDNNIYFSKTTLLNDLKTFKELIKKKKLELKQIKGTMDKSFFLMKTAQISENETTLSLCDTNLSVNQKNKVERILPPEYTILAEYKTVSLNYILSKNNFELFYVKNFKKYYLTFDSKKITIVTFNNKTPVKLCVFNIENHRFMHIDLKTNDLCNVSITDHKGHEIGYGLADYKINLLYYSLKYKYSILCLNKKQQKKFSSKTIDSFKIIKENNRMKIFLRKLIE